MKATLQGAEAERIAERYLLRRGLRTLLRNYRCPGGEIDLVMARRVRARQVICVEVRYRRTRRYGGAVASIGQSKRGRLARAAQQLRHHLSAPYATLPLRFDVVGLDGEPDQLTVTWLRSAFEC